MAITPNESIPGVRNACSVAGAKWLLSLIDAMEGTKDGSNGVGTARARIVLSRASASPALIVLKDGKATITLDTPPQTTDRRQGRNRRKNCSTTRTKNRPR
jgi:hypothetical protein